MRHLWLLISSFSLPICCIYILAISGCSLNPFRSAPSVPKQLVMLKNMDIKDVYMQWPVYMTWIGGALVFVGVVWIIWVPLRKQIGARLIATGIALAAAAAAMIWIGDHMWWLIGGVGLTYALFNPMIVEKFLAKFGIFVDANNDGMIGTGRTAKKAGQRWFWIFRRKAVEQDDIDTERIENDAAIEP